MGEEETPKVLVDGVPTELIFVAGGWMAPSSFQVRRDLRTPSTSPPPSLATRTTPAPSRERPTVTIDVEIEDERVISRRVVAEDPKGVSSIALRRVQVREWVAMDLLQLLLRPASNPTGRWSSHRSPKARSTRLSTSSGDSSATRRR